MTVQSILQVKNGDTLATVRGFLKSLLEQNVADAMLVPLEVPSADHVTPMVVKEPARLDTANPLAPVMRVNSAGMTAQVQRDNGATRLAAVLRPCEVRAVIELAKVGRIDLSRLTLIGVDCMGTYEPDAYAQIARASMHTESPTDELMRWTRQGPIAPYRLRNACQMCEYFVAGNADIAIGLLGMDVRERLLIEARDDIAERLHLPATKVEARGKAITRLNEIRQHRRDQAIKDASQMLTDLPSLLELIASCTACGGCLDACPYCNTAAFKPAKEPHAEREVGPFADLVFLGRRAASCVSCGMCELSCPNRFPLVAIQAFLGRRIRERFNYVPGRSINEKLPWAKASE